MSGFYLKHGKGFVRVLAMLATCLESAANAAVDNARVWGVTHTQAIFSYRAPSEAACQVEVSKQPQFRPLVHDVNPDLFTTAANDGGGSRTRVFVVGKMTVGTAQDGRNYSRALQAATLHFYRITCGSDSVTGTFETRNLPLGLTYVPDPPVDGVTGTRLEPTLSLTDRTQEVIDPITGTLLKRIIMPRDVPYEHGDTAVTAGTGAAWSNPNNVTVPNGAFATYNGRGQDKLVVSIDTNGFSYPTNDDLSLDFVRVTFNGFGSGVTGVARTIQICLTSNGVTCLASPTDVILPASPGVAYYNQSLALGDVMSWPSPFVSSLKGTSTKLLVWKKDTMGSDTISLGNILFYWGSSRRGVSTSGGFHDVCGINDSNGWAKCVVEQNLYAINTVTGETRYMGNYGIFNAGYFSGVYGISSCIGDGVASVLWSNTDPNKVYCFLGLTNNSPATSVVASILLDSTNTALPQNIPDQYMRVVSFTRILPETFTYTWDQLIRQKDPSVPSGWNCGAVAVQYNHLIGSCKAGGQDTYSYLWAFNFGDGTAMTDSICGTIVNGQCSISKVGIAAVNPMYKRNISRFAVNHSVYSYGNTPVYGVSPHENIAFAPYGSSSYSNTLTGNIDATQTTINVISAWPVGASTQTGTITTLDGNGTPGNLSTYVVTSGGDFRNTSVGDQVCAAGQCKTVVSVDSIYAMHVDSNFNPGLSGAAWTNQWITPPSAYQPGEPVSAFQGPHFLDVAIVGDTIVIDNEMLRIVSKNSATQYTVARGCPSFLSGSELLNGKLFGICTGTGSSHNNGASIKFRPNFFNNGQDPMSYFWNFIADPSGADTNFGDPSNSGLHAYVAVAAPYGFGGSHETSRGNIRYQGGGAMAVAGGISNSASLSLPMNVLAPPGSYFAGKWAQGYSYQGHPSNHQSALNSGYQFDYILDQVPLVGGSMFVGNGVGQNSPYMASGTDPTAGLPSTLVEGSLWKVGSGNPNFGAGRDWKYVPQALYCGQKVLRDISGPGSHIVNNGTDYTYCRSNGSGECRGAGDIGGPASRGDEFLNCPGVNANWCIPGESYVGANDQCIGNLMAQGSATAIQYRIPIPPSANTVIHAGASQGRTLGKLFHRPRFGSQNSKPLLDGSWILTPGTSQVTGAEMFLLKNPGMPPLESRNRQTWQMVRVTVKPPAALGVDNAVIEFGHTPDLHCNPRNEVCVAGAAGSEPYYFAGEAFTGVPCSAGCSIEVPSVPSRILYYRIKYRNSSNSPVAQSGILTVGVP